MEDASENKSPVMILAKNETLNITLSQENLSEKISLPTEDLLSALPLVNFLKKVPTSSEHHLLSDDSNKKKTDQLEAGIDKSSQFQCVHNSDSMSNKNDKKCQSSGRWRTDDKLNLIKCENDFKNKNCDKAETTYSSSSKSNKHSKHFIETASKDSIDTREYTNKDNKPNNNGNQCFIIVKGPFKQRSKINKQFVKQTKTSPSLIYSENPKYFVIEKHPVITKSDLNEHNKYNNLESLEEVNKTSNSNVCVPENIFWSTDKYFSNNEETSKNNDSCIFTRTIESKDTIHLSPVNQNLSDNLDSVDDFLKQIQQKRHFFERQVEKSTSDSFEKSSTPPLDFDITLMQKMKKNISLIPYVPAKTCETKEIVMKEFQENEVNDKKLRKKYSAKNRKKISKSSSSSTSTSSSSSSSFSTSSSSSSTSSSSSSSSSSSISSSSSSSFSTSSSSSLSSSSTSSGSDNDENDKSNSSSLSFKSNALNNMNIKVVSQSFQQLPIPSSTIVQTSPQPVPPPSFELCSSSIPSTNINSQMTPLNFNKNLGIDLGCERNPVMLKFQSKVKTSILPSKIEKDEEDIDFTEKILKSLPINEQRISGIENILKNENEKGEERYSCDKIYPQSLSHSRTDSSEHSQWHSLGSASRSRSITPRRRNNISRRRTPPNRQQRSPIYRRNTNSRENKRRRSHSRSRSRTPSNNRDGNRPYRRNRSYTRERSPENRRSYRSMQRSKSRSYSPRRATTKWGNYSGIDDNWLFSYNDDKQTLPRDQRYDPDSNSSWPHPYPSVQSYQSDRINLLQTLPNRLSLDDRINHFLRSEDSAQSLSSYNMPYLPYNVPPQIDPSGSDSIYSSYLPSFETHPQTTDCSISYENYQNLSDHFSPYLTSCEPLTDQYPVQEQWTSDSFDKDLIIDMSSHSNYSNIHPNHNLINITSDNINHKSFRSPYVQKGNVIEVVPESALNCENFSNMTNNNSTKSGNNQTSTPIITTNQKKKNRVKDIRIMALQKKRLEKNMRKTKLQLEFNQLMTGNLDKNIIDELQHDSATQDSEEQRSPIVPEKLIKTVIFVDGVLPGEGSSSDETDEVKDDIKIEDISEDNKMKEFKTLRRKIESNKENLETISEQASNSRDPRIQHPDTNKSNPNLLPIPPPPDMDPPSHLAQPKLKQSVLHQPRNMLFFTANTYNREMIMLPFSIPGHHFSVKLTDPRRMAAQQPQFYQQNPPPLQQSQQLNVSQQYSKTILENSTAQFRVHQQQQQQQQNIRSVTRFRSFHIRFGRRAVIQNTATPVSSFQQRYHRPSFYQHRMPNTMIRKHYSPTATVTSAAVGKTNATQAPDK